MSELERTKARERILIEAISSAIYKLGCPADNADEVSKILCLAKKHNLEGQRAEVTRRALKYSGPTTEGELDNAEN